ncbi:uncharacterized protein METZ01_LOCUS300875, partial [marine metagenome]
MIWIVREFNKNPCGLLWCGGLPQLSVAFQMIDLYPNIIWGSE